MTILLLNLMNMMTCLSLSVQYNKILQTKQFINNKDLCPVVWMLESSRSRQGLMRYIVRLCWVIHAFFLASDDGRNGEFLKVSSIRVQSHSLGSHSYHLLTTHISHLLISLLKLMCPYMNLGRRKTFNLHYWSKGR